MNRIPFWQWLFAATLILLASSCFGADPAGENHPATGVATLYLQAVVAEDWTTCADMLLPKALERRHKDTIEMVKSSATMSEEAGKLKMLGISTFKELEAMTPRDFYVTERLAVHKNINQPEESKARQLSTLKIEVLSVAAEEEGRFVHVLVRTHRDTPDARVHELTLVSLLQDAADKTKWKVVPDTQMPVSEPLNGGEGKKPSK